MPPSPLEETVFSVDEIKVKLCTLSNADAVRLQRIAYYYSKDRLNSDDLLFRAFEKALSGERNCPRNIGVMMFMRGIIRSLASSEFKALKRSPVISENDLCHDDGNDPTPIEHPSLEPSAEETLVLAENVAAILCLFNDDEIARIMIEGIMEEMDAKELQELTGLDCTAYESKRKKIRRRIDKAYPKGFDI